MHKFLLFNGVLGSPTLVLVLGMAVALTVQPTLAATSATDAAASAKAPSSGALSSEKGEEEIEEEAPIGIFLGEYFIRDTHEAENAKTRLSFSLYAAVDPENEKAFAAILARHQSRVHDLVLTAIRLSDNHDFQEPSLDRLKWRMLLRLRRGLPQLKIEHLHFRRYVFFID
jgi:hypothetical protein